MLRRWRAGETLRAPRLNETVDTLNALVGLLPARLREEVAQKQANASEEAEAAQETDDETTDEEQAAASLGVVEQWTLVSESTTTTRITDPDDAETYVDVTKSTELVLLRPDGSIVVVPLE